MNPRLAKELRPLLLPWALATVAAVGHLAARPNSAYFHGEFGDFITGLAGFAFILGVLVLAAMPMGSELHERTLGMLFSQPISRARLWKEKLFAATVMISLLAIAHGLTTLVMGKLTFFHGLLWVAFVVAAICSVGYHTLATRSVLVGIASAAGMPYAITLSAYLIVRYLLGVQLELSDQAALTLILIAFGAYSIFSLWLSRSQFINLELKDAVGSRAAEVPAALVPPALSNLFRPKPTGVALNLIRKEVCLHRPIFLVSAIFVAAWLLTLLLMLLRPAWHDTCVATFHGLTGAQVVLMIILGGCTALGDDKALGTSAWHLTLPVSARRQWSIKLLSAFGTTLAVAVILPTFLAVLTLFQARVGFLAARSDTLMIAALLSLAAFVVGFWSASITTSTVRAALTCILTFVGIASVGALGISLSELLFNSWPLQRELVAKLLAHYQATPSSLAQHAGVSTCPIVLVCVICAVVALIQSLTLFRRGQTSMSIRIKYAVVLVSITFAGAFWCADLNQSQRFAWTQFDSELQHALASLPRSTRLNELRSMSLQELEKTGKLTRTTSTWLRNCSLKTTAGVDQSTQMFARGLWATFPNGEEYTVTQAEPLTP